MRDLVPGDRVDATFMPELGTGIVEMVLETCVLVGFETSEGPYHDAFNEGELVLSKLLPARTP